MVLNKEAQADPKESWLSMCGSFLMKNPWTSSFIEILFTLFVSNAAILISVFAYLLLQDPSAKKVPFDDLLLDTLKETIKPTEILVYILGIIAPAIWIIVRNIQHWRHRTFLFVVVMAQGLVVISATIIFAFSLANILKNTPFATGWAWLCFALALGAWYATLVYQKAVLDAANQHIEQPRPGKASGDSILNALRSDK